jgi:hypothetical protein
MSKSADELTGTFGDEDAEAERSYADADSLLGASIPAVTWPEIGAGVTGTITNVDTSDQRDLDGNVKKFDNGDVRRQVILTLQTTMKESPDDDGRRRLFVKGSMVKSFREAIAKAKAPGPRMGGKVSVVYSADGEVKGKGLNPPKLFTVEYQAPK